MGLMGLMGLKRRVDQQVSKRWIGYSVAVAGTVVVTGALKLFSGHINSTTVALGLLLLVLFVATGWGSRPAVLSSLLGVVCINFFFLPPIGRLTIDDPDNWIALFAFSRHRGHGRPTFSTR